MKREEALPTGRPLDWRERTDDCRRVALVNRRWRAKLKYRYDITPEEFYEMYDKQHGRCAICKIDIDPHGRGTHVDHKGEQVGGRKWNGGLVRGLLCSRCNMALGWYEKNQEAVDDYIF